MYKSMISLLALLFVQGTTINKPQFNHVINQYQIIENDKLDITKMLNYELLTTTKAAPTDIEVEKLTMTSITIKHIKGAEYSIDSGNTWQDSPKFEDLDLNTEYYILVRFKATNEEAASPSSEIKVKTLEKEHHLVIIISISLTVIISGVIYYFIRNNNSKKELINID